MKIQTSIEKKIFIQKRIEEILKKYNEKIKKPKIEKSEIEKNIDYKIINNIFDYRVINRIITNALIKALEDSQRKKR